MVTKPIDTAASARVRDKKAPAEAHADALVVEPSRRKFPAPADRMREDYSMARHEIKLKFPSHEVVNRDVTIQVKSNDVLLGRIKISKGTIDWWPASNSKTHYKVTWESFKEMMQTQGKQVKK